MKGREKLKEEKSKPKLIDSEQSPWQNKVRVTVSTLIKDWSLVKDQ